jgi:hypothetical protein
MTAWSSFIANSWGRRRRSTSRARGSVLLGQSPRRAPRPDTQREHELAIARLVADLERRDTPRAFRVLTERECRRLEADGARGYSVELPTAGHPKRWPDLVLQSQRRKDAIELELAPKTTDRLAAILTGYAHSDYARVLLLVESPALARRLARVAKKVTAATTSRWRTPPVFHIDARPDADAETTAAVHQALGR